MHRYEGKRVAVIGGTSGMGLATARHFLEEGAQVLATGRSEESLNAARSALGDGAVVKSNVADMAEIRALRSTIEERLGQIELLFVNAGISLSGPFEETSETRYDEVFAVNTKGPYFTVQELAPLVVEGGAIVVTTSVANVKGLSGLAVYSATKAALRSLVRCFARELLPRNVRVNAVSPGPIDTTVLAKALGPEAAEKMREGFRETNPMKRLGTPEEIARAVAFLGFEATFTTGTELAVDGGASQL